MSRYFFDIRTGSDLYPDEEGLELADMKSAQVEAAQSLVGAVLDDDRESSEPIAVEVRMFDVLIFTAAITFEPAAIRQ